MRRLLVTTAAAALMLLGIMPTAARADSTLVAPSETWTKLSADTFNLYSPDTNSLYYTTAYVTTGGIDTVVSGDAPHARYWSIAAYRTETKPVADAYDAQIPVEPDGRYQVVLASDCQGVTGTCLDTTTSNPVGFLIYRLYVPDDLGGAETGGVPLPTVSYRLAGGTATADLTGLDLPAPLQVVVDDAEHAVGQTLTAILRSDPGDPAAPSPGAPPTTTVRAGGSGPFSNPDNVYLHMPYTTSDGDLVVTGTAPTYRHQAADPANDRGVTDGTQQVRYWSLCTEAQQGLTVACLRDEQIAIPPGTDRFVAIVAPSCPVAGYANCLPAGLRAVQNELLYRNLLPSAGFVPFAGSYALSGSYIVRG
jgi:hypothetical protein